MKILFTLFSLLFFSLTVSAGNVFLPSTTFTWTESSGLAATDQDIIIVKAGQTLTINNPIAPNVSITIESEGICNIQNISNQPGENIQVKNGGILNITPLSGTNITIGQNITIEQANIPVSVNDAKIIELMNLIIANKAHTLISTVNIVDNGNYPKITFAGIVNIGYGGIFNVEYPVDQTATQIELSDLDLHAATVPQEITSLLKLLLPAEFQMHANKLDHGVIPPIILYKTGSALPNITGEISDFELQVLEATINITDYIRNMVGMAGITVPANGSYISRTLDLDGFTIPAPETYTKDVPLTIKVPHTDSQNYTAILPQVSSNSGTWYLVDSENENTELDLSDSDPAKRTYTIAIENGITTRLSITMTPKGSSIDNESVDPGQIMSVSYYTLTGKQIFDPAAGLFIKKTVFDSGKVKTEKVILK